MSLSQRELAQIAQEIHVQLCMLPATRRKWACDRLGGLNDEMRGLQVLERKLRLCQSQSFHGAAARLSQDIEGLLCNLPYRIQEVQRAVKSGDALVLNTGEIYRDLVQTTEEFGQLRYDDDQSLTVATDRIVLREMDLGDFEIRLHLPSLSKGQPLSAFRVVALDPHPAASNEEVTHPHVSDENLCPGDAGAPIRASLESGRICDFFLLVRSVLANYNPASPFVALEKWHGVPCHDCGALADNEDAFFCHVCEETFCRDCAAFCSRCEEETCLACLGTCAVCEEFTCEPCMGECPDCHMRRCQTCIEDKSCPCHEENKEIEDGQQQTTVQQQNALVAAHVSGTETEAT